MCSKPPELKLALRCSFRIKIRTSCLQPAHTQGHASTHHQTIACPFLPWTPSPQQLLRPLQPSALQACGPAELIEGPAEVTQGRWLQEGHQVVKAPSRLLHWGSGIC